MLTKADQQRRRHTNQVESKNSVARNSALTSFESVTRLLSPKCRSSIVRDGSFLWVLVLLALLGDVATGQENVGCRFIRSLCIDRNEICFDDKVFGKCVSITGAHVEDIDSIPLSNEQMNYLSNTLEELNLAGMGWDHPYVQCRIKQQISAMQHQTPLAADMCISLSPGMDEDYSDMPKTMIANFNNWYDKQKKKSEIQDLLLQQMLAREQEQQPRPEQGDFLPPAYVNEVTNNGNRRYHLNGELLPMTVERGFGFDGDKRSSKLSYPGFNMYDTPSNGHNDYPSAAGDGHGDIEMSNDEPPVRLERIYDIQEQQMAYPKQLTPLDEIMLTEQAYAANRRRLKHPQKQQQQHHNKEKIFVEGDGLFLPERQMPKQHAAAETFNAMDEKNEAKIRRVLADILGFTRHERLDVKKPGPLVGRLPPQPHPAGEVTTDLVPAVVNKTQEVNGHAQAEDEEAEKEKQKPIKKEVVKDHSNQDHAFHIVDEGYAHVFVKNPIDSWNDGVRIMNELGNILHMQGFFTYLTVQPHEVSFRVNSDNPEHKTAADIAKSINENRGVKNNLLRRLGVTVTHAGVGDRITDVENNVVSVEPIEISESTDVARIIMITLAGAGVAAIIVVLVTIVLIKQNGKDRDKLGHLQSNTQVADNSSKDYQDLCRGRMASKGSSNAEHVPSGRITSLSKENDRPPSSRSSTSSWCEEPALTNMDISTGHMVLSYMEDHLRNKGRLQREWEALCRYEAEPNARDTAQQPQCTHLNRPIAPLPYDHSRVVLNHLSNAEGLNFINASTIADHDPRAPAYVAAQGPLPSTLAHFWQMIWEQGAVVIVALCRLQENGTMACARYWPEEGAEVYHIYEVHLVSEHIWCEDYLVRSFYLKNLRTSETRTVTQFHFLSWPQGGVPTQAKTLLDFRRKVNKSYRGRSCPIVVHSSLGAGRTGAYILLDLVLGRMNKGAREIDIAATLEHLRDQRAGLVATRQQFEFVLMAVAEEVHAILKALPSNQSAEKRESESNETNAAATTDNLVDLSGGTKPNESKPKTVDEEKEIAEQQQQQPHSSKSPPKAGPSPPARKSN